MSEYKTPKGTGPVWMTMACFWFFTAIGMVIAKRGLPFSGQWGLTVFVFLLFAFMGMILISGGPYALIKNPELLTWRSSGAALLANAIIFAFYGMIVLTLGVTPTRYHQREVPRSACMTYFAISAAFAIGGGACVMAHRLCRPDAGPKER